MCSSPLTSASKSPAGFTLLELLVVIAIIGVLAAIIAPVYSGVQNRARTVQAVSDMRNIKAAVASYYTDYGKYPTTSGQDYYGQGANGGYDTVFGDPNASANYRSSDLFNILRGLPDDHYGTGNQSNPNQTVYWGGQFAKSATQPRSGITTQDVTDGGLTIHKGSLVDPWGNQYVVWFNVSKSGDLTTALGWFYQDYQNATPQNHVTCGLPPLGVECASLGPDGDWGTKGNLVLKGSDDIVTWSHQ